MDPDARRALKLLIDRARRARAIKRGPSGRMIDLEGARKSGLARRRG